MIFQPCHIYGENFLEAAADAKVNWEVLRRIHNLLVIELSFRCVPLKFLSEIMIQSFRATPAFRCNKILSPGAAEVQLEHRDTIFAGNPSP